MPTPPSTGFSVCCRNAATPPSSRGQDLGPTGRRLASPINQSSQVHCLSAPPQPSSPPFFCRNMIVGIQHCNLTVGSETWEADGLTNNPLELADKFYGEVLGLSGSHCSPFDIGTTKERVTKAVCAGAGVRGGTEKLTDRSVDPVLSFFRARPGPVQHDRQAPMVCPR